MEQDAPNEVEERPNDVCDQVVVNRMDRPDHPVVDFSNDDDSDAETVVLSMNEDEDTNDASLAEMIAPTSHPLAVAIEEVRSLLVSGNNSDRY